MERVTSRQPSRQASTGIYVRGSRGLQLRDQRVRKLVSRMRTAMPWLEDSDLPACRAWSELEVLASRAYGELLDNGLVNEHGQPRNMIRRNKRAIYLRQFTIPILFPIHSTR